MTRVITLIQGHLQVLIAQEKMASNTVYVFEKKDAKFMFMTEIRSVIENSNRPASTCIVKMLRQSATKGGQRFGQVSYWCDGTPCPLMLEVW